MELGISLRFPVFPLIKCPTLGENGSFYVLLQLPNILQELRYFCLSLTMSLVRCVTLGARTGPRTPSKTTDANLDCVLVRKNFFLL